MNELSLHKLAKDFYDERLFIANEKVIFLFTIKSAT